MNKQELCEAVRIRCGMDNNQAEEAVSAVFKTIAKELGECGKLTIRKFGEFSTRYKPERMARNPNAGTPAICKARTVVRFKPATTLKAIINHKRIFKK